MRCRDLVEEDARRVERRVDFAGLHVVAELHGQVGRALLATQADDLAFGEAEPARVDRCELQVVGDGEPVVRRACRLRGGVVLVEVAAGREQERKLLRHQHGRGDVFNATQRRRLAVGELVSVHHRRARVVLVEARPLQPAELIHARVADAGALVPERADLVPDLLGGRVGEMFFVAHDARDVADNLPVGAGLALREGGAAHALEAALAVHECAVLLERRRGGQEDVAEFLRGLVHEKVLHDHEVELLHRAARGVHVRVRHHDVVADRPENLQLPGVGCVHHVDHVESGMRRDRHVPRGLEAFACLRDGHVAGQEFWLAAHVRRTLHVVLATQRIDAGAGLADVAGDEREIDERHDALGALDVLGHPEAVDAERRLRRGVEPRGFANFRGGHAADVLDLLRQELADEIAILRVFGEARADELFVDETLVEDGGAHGVEEDDVGARVELEVQRGVVAELDVARVDDDEVGAVSRGLLDARAGDGMALGRIGAADEDRPGDFDFVERVGGGAGAERHFHGGGGGRVANARAAIDVVRPEGDAGEFLRDVVLLVGAARRAEQPDAVGAVLRARLGEAVGDELVHLIPTDLLPLAVAADHRRRDAVLRVDVVESVAALHAGVAVVARAVGGADGRDLAGARADVHLAAGAAIRADGLRPVGRDATREHGDVLQRAGRAGVDARAATDAAAVEQRLAAHGQDACLVAAVPRLPDELPLHLLADAHATVARYALRHVDGDVGMRRILHERHLGLRRGARAAGLHIVFAEITVKLFVGKLRRGLDGIILREQSE